MPRSYPPVDAKPKPKAATPISDFVKSITSKIGLSHNDNLKAALHTSRGLDPSIMGKSIERDRVQDSTARANVAEKARLGPKTPSLQRAKFERGIKPY